LILEELRERVVAMMGFDGIGEDGNWLWVLWSREVGSDGKGTVKMVIERGGKGSRVVTG
jgi:hypothetical protein